MDLNEIPQQSQGHRSVTPFLYFFSFGLTLISHLASRPFLFLFLCGLVVKRVDWERETWEIVFGAVWCFFFSFRASFELLEKKNDVL